MEYRVNSDGTGLTLLTEVREVPADLFSIGSLRFSPEGDRIAYSDGRQIILGGVDGSESTSLGALPQGFAGLDFLPEPGCLAVFGRPDENTLVVEQACVGESQRRALDTLELPPLPNGFWHSGILRISPDGRRLLAYGREWGGHPRLYIKEIGSDEPPRVLFQSPDHPPDGAYLSCYGAGPARWQDENTIEFVVLANCGDQQHTLFYRVDWGGELTVLLDLQAGRLGSLGPEVVGGWSPDGSEFAIAYDRNIHERDALKGKECGLYIIDLSTGEQRLAISGFWIHEIVVWQPGFLQQ